MKVNRPKSIGGGDNAKTGMQGNWRAMYFVCENSFALRGRTFEKNIKDPSP